MTNRVARDMPTRRRRADAPVPDRAALRAAALAHLARFGTTRAGLAQVLDRFLQRWARRAAEAGTPDEDIAAQILPVRAQIDQVVRDMAELGAVDDAAFAGSRARSLTRAGRSRRAVQAHLAVRGVDEDTAGTVLDDALGARAGQGQETELAAALIFARRRRAGPFAPPPDAADGQDDPAMTDDRAMDGRPVGGRGGDDPATLRRRRVLEAMARAGFGRAVAETALDMDPDEAEERIIRMKSA
jgi:regulatory protein